MAMANVSKAYRYGVIVELAKALDELSPQFGKTALMKLVYILQEVYKVPLGYRFSLYTYGPYSTEVLVDLDSVRQANGVRVDQLKDDQMGYKISPGPELDKYIEGAYTFLRSHEGSISRLVKDFGGLRARDLELRATIVYVNNNGLETSGDDRGSLATSVQELKPQFSEEEIRDAIRELVVLGVIE